MGSAERADTGARFAIALAGMMWFDISGVSAEKATVDVFVKASWTEVSSTVIHISGIERLRQRQHTLGARDVRRVWLTGLSRFRLQSNEIKYLPR